MSENLYWVPLPDGRPWWPGIKLSRDRLDPQRHAGAIAFYDQIRKKRGLDALNKDCLVVLCSVAGASGEAGGANNEGHRFAVIPETSLRPYFAYKEVFAEGIISSGAQEGQVCSPRERKRLKETLSFVNELIKQAQSSNLEQSTVAAEGAAPPSAQSSVYNLPGGPVKPPTGKHARSEENKELSRLKKELQSVRKKKVQQSSSQRTVSPTSDVEQNANILEATKLPLMAGQILALASQLLPECYVELNSQTIRLWDFCHSFSHELGLVEPGAFPQSLLRAQPCFASICTFEACLSEPSSPLYAEIAMKLLNFLSSSCGTNPDERWDFSGPLLKARLGGKCTELTWECLLATLIEAGIVDRPTNVLDRRAILDDIVNAICRLKTTKEVFVWRLQEEGAERENPFDSTPLEPLKSIEIKATTGVGRNRILTDDIFNITDFFIAESTIEPFRDALETLDINGNVIARTPELARAIEWEEKLYGRFLSMVRKFILARRVRSMSFGKDYFGRSLYSFLGDFAEEECRVWARDDANDRWFVYRGEMVLRQLMEILPDLNARQAILSVIYTSRVRFRPSTVSELRQAKVQGWRFTRNQLINRRVVQYTPEFGLRPGFVVAYRQAGQGKVMYKVVFSKQDWASAVEMLEDEVIHLITCSERLMGDFPLASAALDLPPHSLGLPWNRVHPDETLLVLVQGHIKRAIGFGVVLATTAPTPAHPDCDALVLQDGGEFVPVFGRAQLSEVINLGGALSTRSSVIVDGIHYPRLNRVERFRPLMHLTGPPIGAAGLIKLWGQEAVTSIESLRKPMLDSEQQLQKALKPGAELWPTPKHGECWRDSVLVAKDIADFALAFECLLNLADRVVKEGKIETHQVVSTPRSEAPSAVNPNQEESIAQRNNSAAQDTTPALHEAEDDLRKRQKVDGEAEGPDQDDQAKSATEAKAVMTEQTSSGDVQMQQQENEPPVSTTSAEIPQGERASSEDVEAKVESGSEVKPEIREEPVKQDESSSAPPTGAAVDEPSAPSSATANISETSNTNASPEDNAPASDSRANAATTAEPELESVMAPVELPQSALVSVPPSSVQGSPQKPRQKETRSPRKASVSESPRRSPRILAAESPRRESPRKLSTGSTSRRTEHVKALETIPFQPSTSEAQVASTSETQAASMPEVQSAPTSETQAASMPEVQAAPTSEVQATSTSEAQASSTSETQVAPTPGSQAAPTSEVQAAPTSESQVASMPEVQAVVNEETGDAAPEQQANVESETLSQKDEAAPATEPSATLPSSIETNEFSQEDVKASQEEVKTEEKGGEGNPDATPNVE